MGKINQGILDGFKGKVGTVVGFYWKGKPVMRGYKRFFKDAHSEAQMVVRLRFAAINSLAVAFKSAADLGFNHRAASHGNTELNNFVQLNWDAITADNTAAVDVEYSDLVVSYGSLPQVHFSPASYQTPQTVEANFAAIGEASGASDSDRVYLFVYNPSQNIGILSDGALRSSQKVTATLPASWSGESVHVWGFAVGGAEFNKGVASHSAYLGEGIIG